jgi:hypothetical protein
MKVNRKISRAQIGSKSGANREQIRIAVYSAKFLHPQPNRPPLKTSISLKIVLKQVLNKFSMLHRSILSREYCLQSQITHA